MKEIRTKILSNRVAAPARAGAIAPADVFVPAGNTGMEPGKTSFFQALGVPTKIARGTIEITTDLKLVEAGGKVGASEAVLLNMLNISPFTYGMSITQIYDDGQTFGPEVLDIEDSQLLKALSTAIATISTISLATSYPTLPSVMHSLVNSYKNVLAVAIETEFSWPEIEELKDRIANPDAYAVAAPVAAATSGEAAPAAAEEEKEGSEEESGDEGKTAIFCPIPVLKLTESSRFRWSFRLNYLKSHVYVMGNESNVLHTGRMKTILVIESMNTLHQNTSACMIFRALTLRRSASSENVSVTSVEGTFSSSFCF